DATHNLTEMDFAELCERAQRRVTLLLDHVRVRDEKRVTLRERERPAPPCPLEQARPELVEQIADVWDDAAAHVRAVETFQQRGDAVGSACPWLVLSSDVHNIACPFSRNCLPRVTLT